MNSVVDYSLTVLEQPMLCQVDYIPCVSTAVSSPVRVLGGIAGSALSIISIFLSKMTMQPNDPLNNRRRYSNIAHAHNNLMRSLQQIFRGFLANHPISGNATLFISDKFMRNF